MKADDLLFISVGGAAATIAQKIALKSRRDLALPPMRVLILDTDDAVLETVTHTEGLSVTIFGTQRLSGRGTGGDCVLGQSAFRDDAAALMQQIGTPRLVVLLTCCGGGTSGACEQLLTLLRDRGIANIVFATEPFPFEGDARRKAASIIMPTLCNTANAITTVALADLLPKDGVERTAAEAFDTVAERLAAGICLLWTMLVHPGYIQFDVEHLRQLLERAQGGSLHFTFADATAEGEERAAHLSDAMLHSARFRAQGVNYLENAGFVCVGVLAGDDLRLSELKVLMTDLRKVIHKKAEVALGTVNHQAFNGNMSVVLMAFAKPGTGEPTTEDGLQPPKGHGRGARAKSLTAVKDRFDDVERTIIDGVDYDVPTYSRRNVWLKR